MSLYGKYRPQNFSNLVGQDYIRQTLLSEIVNNTLTHAYLFAGPRGTGKTSSARLVSKSLNCTNRAATGEPCDACEMCLLIRDGNLIDVLEIDAASNRGIDEIRDLKEKIDYAPTRAISKIYIIDEVHMLTKEAFNALLKTLEEPPTNVYFILCTTEVHKIPETIISRCQRFDFKRVDARTIMARLAFIAQSEGIEAEERAIELIAHHVEGGLRDAIGLFEQLSIDKKLVANYVREHLGITGHDTVQKFIEFLKLKNSTGAIELINEVYTSGADLASFLRETLEALRIELISSVHKNESTIGSWLSMIEHLESAKDMMRTATIPQLPLEIAVIRIAGLVEVKRPVVAEKIAAPAQQKPIPSPLAAQVPSTSHTSAAPIIPIATPAQEKAATASEQATAAIIHQEISNEMYQQPDAIRTHWRRVVDHVQPPALRRSLEQGKVVEKDAEQIELVFQTRFHMEKVNTIEHKEAISKAIQHIFGRNIRISCSLTQIDVAAPRQQEEIKPKKIEKVAPVEEMDLSAKAFELFGSE